MPIAIFKIIFLNQQTRLVGDYFIHTSHLLHMQYAVTEKGISYFFFYLAKTFQNQSKDTTFYEGIVYAFSTWAIVCEMVLGWKQHRSPIQCSMQILLL